MEYRDEQMTRFPDSLKISPEEWAFAKKHGISVEVPAEFFLDVADKPYWAKMKRAIGVSPYQETISRPLGEPYATPKGIEAPAAAVEGAGKEPASPPGAPAIEAKPALDPDVPLSIQMGGQGPTAVSQGPSTVRPGIPVVVSASSPLFQSPVEKQAMDFFQSRGWSREQAAGIVGNLVHESAGMNPEAVSKDGYNSYGLAQWTGPRRIALFDYAASRGEAIPSFQTQLEFVDQELGDSEKAAGDALRGAQTPEEAARIFSERFERPGIPHMERRVANAQRVYGGEGGNVPASVFPRMTRGDFLSGLRSTGLPNDQVNAVVDLSDSMADAWADITGRTPEEWYGDMFAAIRTGGKDFGREISAFQSGTSDDILFQMARKSGKGDITTGKPPLPKGGKEIDTLDELIQLAKEGSFVRTEGGLSIDKARKYANPERDYILDELYEKGHVVNPDGTVTLYHATTKERSEQLLKDGYFKAAKDAPDNYGVYFSTSPEVAESYGDGTLVRVRVKLRDLNLDDAFPGKNRMDFQVNTRKGIYSAEKIEPFNPSSSPGGGEHSVLFQHPSDLVNTKFRTSTPEEFAVQRDKSRYKQFLTPYAPDEMRGWQLYMTDDGVGFALTPEMDMVGVFNNSGNPGAGREAVVLAIAKGAKTCDCIPGFLDIYYNSFGFIEKSRMPWDDNLAPQGWNYDKYGRPEYVSFFEFPGSLSRDPVDTRARFGIAWAKRDSRGRGKLWGTDEWDRISREQIRGGMGPEEPGSPGGGTGNVGRTLEQRIASPSPKGAVQFLDDMRGIIHFFRGADVTTPIHEIAHALFEHLSPEDFRIVSDWLGKEDVGRTFSSPDFSTEDKERFAKGFEAYIMEGRAPSLRLRPVFEKLKRWFFEIYRSIRALGVELNDNMRSLYDRLLAKEVERRTNIIEQMNEEYNVNAGNQPTREMLDEYDQLMAVARRKADRIIRDRIQKREDKIRRDAEKWARASVREDPLYHLVDYVVKKGGFSLKSLEALGFGNKEMLDALRKKRVGLWSKNGKIQVDQIAMDTEGPWDGDPDRLLDMIVNGESRQDAVSRLVDEYMREYRADIQEAISEKHEVVLDEEIRALKEVTEKSTQDWANVPRKGFGKLVDELTGVTKLKDAESVSEYDALRAGMKMASRAAAAAFRSGNREGALKEKLRQQEIFANYKARAKARVEYKRIIGQLKAMLTDKKIDWDYKEQVRQLLSPYELQGRSARTREKLESLQEFIDRKEAEGEAVFIPKDLLARLSKKPIKDLTIEELREIRDVAQHIAHLGRKKYEYLGNQRKREFLKSKVEVINRINKLAPEIRETPNQPLPPSARELTKMQRLSRWLEHANAQLIQPEFLIHAMDGFEDMGPVYQEMYLEVKHAEDRKLALQKELKEKWEKQFEPFKKRQQKWLNEKFQIPGFPYSMTKEEMLFWAFNSLHPDNRLAMKGGYSGEQMTVTDETIDRVVSMLTPEEMNLVKGFVEEVVPIAKEDLWQAHRNLTGVPPKKIEGTYFPIIPDPELADFIKEKRAADQAISYFRDIFSATSVATTGSVIQRTGGKKAPYLGFSALLERLEDDIMYATHAVPVRNLLKLILDKDFKRTVETTYGKEFYRQLNPWLKEIANPGNAPMLPFEKEAGTVRRNAVMYIMAFRLSTTLQQPFAFFQTMDELGSGWAMSGMFRYLRSPGKWSDFIYEKSEALANRSRSFDRDIKEASYNLGKSRGALKDFTMKYGMALTAFFDQQTANATWLGAYMKALEGKVSNVGVFDEAAAVDYADGVVSRTQASAQPKNLAAVARGNEFSKLFMTFFYTFFNTYWNRTWEHWRAYRNPNVDFGMWDLAKAFFLVTVIPGIAQQAFNEREAPDKWWKYPLVPLKYATNGLPLVRDVGSVIAGYEYRGGLVGGAFNAIAGLAGKLNRKKPARELELMLDTLKLTGYLTGVPTDQALIVAEGMLKKPKRRYQSWTPARLIWREKAGR